jgi:2-methylcitrate dehydratase PrpD
MRANQEEGQAGVAIATDLWQRYGRLYDADVPEATWRWAQHSVLDWYGVTLTGSTQPLSRLLRDEYAGSSGPAAVIGTSARADVRTAALLNGAASHALDFDDSNKAGGGHHPSAPVLPAALAVAQAEGSTGAEFLAAVVAGFEFSYRVGAAMGGGLFKKGWHPTSALGVFGALAAAATLLRLDDEEFGNAFGIAASLSGGLQANFGTMTKPLHAGLAAQSGVTAARLGRRGITARAEALETMAGLAELMGDGEAHPDELARLGDSWVTTRTIFKYHASCLGTHAPMEATRAAAAGVGRDEVGGVVVRVNPMSLRICRFDYPATGLEAKFSIRAATALTLLRDNTGDPATFSDERVHAADFLDMMARIEVRTDPDAASQNAYVTLEARDGRHSEGHADSSIPAADVDGQEAKLRRKFLRLAEPVIGDRAAAMADRLLDVRSVSNMAALPR